MKRILDDAMPYAVGSRRPLGLPIAWWITLSTSFGVGVGYTAITSTFFGQFVPVWSEIFSLPRTGIAFALTIMSYTVVITAVLSGMLVDRLGAGRVLAASQIILGGVFALLVIMDGSLGRLYVIAFAVAVAGSGTLPATYTRILLIWFDRRRGIAFGLSLAGFGVSAAFAPPIIQWMLVEYNWKIAVLSLAAFISVIGGMNALFLSFSRVQSPAEIDGGSLTYASDHVRNEDVPVFYRDILKYKELYLLSAAFFLLGIVTMGVVFNLPTILVDGGLSASQMGFAMGVFGATFTIARPLVGYLLDRVPAALITVFMTAMGMLGVLAILFDGGVWFICAGLIILALGLGSEHNIKAFVISKLFPRGGYARVYATVYSAYAIGVGMGPPLLAYSNDRLGTYAPVLWAFAGVFAVGGFLLVWVARRADRLIPSPIDRHPYAHPRNPMDMMRHG